MTCQWVPSDIRNFERKKLVSEYPHYVIILHDSRVLTWKVELVFGFKLLVLIRFQVVGGVVDKLFLLLLIELLFHPLLLWIFENFKNLKILGKIINRTLSWDAKISFMVLSVSAMLLIRFFLNYKFFFDITDL